MIYFIFRPTELLTADDRAQLSSWIGQKCHFELLYKISRDNCCPKKFHQLCDRKGPTVTILYNTDNSSYGGFLSQSWESSGGCIKDQHAFLFTLSYNGVRKPRKFPVTKPNQAAYANNNLGPTFGKVESENLQGTGYQHYNAEPYLSMSNLFTVVQKSLSQLFKKICSWGIELFDHYITFHWVSFSLQTLFKL